MAQIPPLRKQTECLGGKSSTGVNGLISRLHSYTAGPQADSTCKHKGTHCSLNFSLFLRIWQSGTLSLTALCHSRNEKWPKKYLAEKLATVSDFSASIFFFSFFQIPELFNTILMAYASRALFLKRSCMQEHVHSMQHSSVVASSSKYRVQLSRKFPVQRNMHSTALGSIHHQHNEAKELQSCSRQRRISFPDFS